MEIRNSIYLVSFIFLLINFVNPPAVNAQHPSYFQDTLYRIGYEDKLVNKAHYQQMKANLMKSALEYDEAYTVLFIPIQNYSLGDTLVKHGSFNVIPTDMKSEQEKAENLIDQAFPDFSMQDVMGNTLSKEDLLGKVVVVNAWFTRCPPCIAEIPLLNALKQKYEGQAVTFLSFALEDSQQLKKFFKRIPFDFRTIPKAGNFIQQFGFGFPKNIIIDKNGITRYIGGGLVGEAGLNGNKEAAPISLQAMEDRIEVLLKE